MNEKTVGRTYWFDLPVADLDRAKAFYNGVLGWRFQKLMREEIMNYWMIEVDGTFIGGLRKTRAENRAETAPVIYFHVDSLERAIQQAEALGGRLEGERVDLGLNRGCFQWLRDPDHNLIAFWVRE
ncbi:MAG: VOC family protein [Nitrospiria bacterium]